MDGIVVTMDGVVVTLEEFEAWIVDGKINGMHYDADSIFYAIQTRVWHCPVCAGSGISHRCEHSLDSTIDVGNPICPEGHNMELGDTNLQEIELDRETPCELDTTT